MLGFLQRWNWPILLWLLGIVAVGYFFLDLPMSLRWPARIGIPLAVAWVLWLAIRPRGKGGVRREWKARLGTGLLLSALLLAYLSSDFWEQHLFTYSKKASVEHVSTLSEELARRGVELVILGMPQYKNVIDGDPRLKHVPRDRANAWAGKVMGEMTKAGIPVLDSFPSFATHAPQPSDWLEDQCHLPTEQLATIAKDMVGLLREQGTFGGEDQGRSCVLMGDCFSGQLGNEMKKGNFDLGELKIVRRDGDSGRVANSLFLFPERYLDRVEKVIWLMAYPQFTKTSFPPLITEPDFGDKEPVPVLVKIDSMPQLSKKELTGLPYPDALFEIGGKVMTEEGEFTKDQLLVLVAHGVINRRQQRLAKIREGRQLYVNLVPFESQAREDPGLTETSVISDIETFSIDRYWIHSWNLER